MRWICECFSEFYRPDPFGGIIEADRSPSAASRNLRIRAARNSYASAHIVVDGITTPGEYSLEIDCPLPVEVYREWFHFNKPDQRYYPDALIPIKLPFRSRIPDQDHQIPKQTAAAFWLDIWTPANAKPDTYRGKVTLTSGSESRSIPIEVSVLDLTVANEDVITLDSNSYGTSWMFDQYPKTLSRKDDASLFRLIHSYHRIFYEHRSTFHQLGYGHAGKVGPEFAPELAGSGKNKQITKLGPLRSPLWTASRWIGLQGHSSWSNADSFCLPAHQPRMAGIVLVVGRAGI